MGGQVLAKCMVWNPFLEQLRLLDNVPPRNILLDHSIFTKEISSHVDLTTYVGWIILGGFLWSTTYALHFFNIRCNHFLFPPDHKLSIAQNNVLPQYVRK